MLGYLRENNGKTDFDNRNQQLCWHFIQTVYREKKWKHAVGRPMACYICFCEKFRMEENGFFKI